MRKFKDVNELVNILKPDYPVYCIRPESIKKSTKFLKITFQVKYFMQLKQILMKKLLNKLFKWY